jgi:tRNA-Thr(GGU) m(6)t(6)A37 methyltransferase TsaA
MPSFTTYAASLAVTVAAGVLVFSNIQLRRELKRQIELRQAERQGRIRAETKPKLEAQQETAWKVFPIATVRSVFAKRSGTPRQPGLVTAAESRIEFVPELKQAIDSVGEFSHIWVLFLFNQNTNIAKRLKAKHPFSGLKLLVEPPKAGGKKVGVLACRTPHRPNPVGLSLCKIVRVEKAAIVVAGLDCLDGTPVIDIKPYLPIVEVVPDAIVPSWIYQGVDEDREVTVEWACPRSLPGDAADVSEKTLSVIEEVLSRDIRSTHQIELGNRMDDDWSGEVIVGDLTVTYSVSKAKLVKIQGIHPSKSIIANS